MFIISHGGYYNNASLKEAQMITMGVIDKRQAGHATREVQWILAF